MKLITPTLLNSFRYYLHSTPEDPADEILDRHSFLQLLRREPMPENEVSQAILNGRKLEKDVMDYAMAPYDYAPPVIERIGTLCRGGLWQQSVKRVFDDKYLLYGRLDHMRANVIIDIKYSEFYDIGKFLRSAQHRIYLYCLQDERIAPEHRVNHFKYVIGNGSYGKLSNTVWIEEYFWHSGIEEELRGMINQFEDYLRDDTEAGKLFDKYWEALS